MDKQISILIVGAGPTGLMMANELARHGVSFRLIDKKTERTSTSNATWIQSRTLEIFNHIGIVDRLLKRGHPCHALNVYIDGKRVTQISLKEIESFYPFVLMLPQSETEKLLTDHLQKLNGHVERGVELVDIQHQDKLIHAIVRNVDGKIETIVCDWLIASDGATSFVREKCNIFFGGEDLSEQFVVADSQIESYMSKNEVHLFFDVGTMFVASPMGGDRYRITANIHLPLPWQFFTEREVIEMAQERAHGEFYVKAASGISPFWIHGKAAKSMRFNSIFLVGDAAHIHSPLGGQGMNMGIQDAYNLAWKLALVIKGKAKPALLDSYQAERHPVAAEVIQKIEQLTKMILFDNDFLTKLKKFSDKLSHHPELSKEIANQLSQVTICYQDSPIIHYQETAGVKSPQPGERAPDIIVNNNLHNVLLFTGLPAKDKQSENIMEIQKWLNHYADLIKVHVVTGDTKEGEILHRRYHIKTPAIYIIRPDNYIAYCSQKL